MVELNSSGGVYTIQIFQICNRTKQQHTVVGGSVHIYLVESATRNQAIAVENTDVHISRTRSIYRKGYREQELSRHSVYIIRSWVRLLLFNLPSF